MASYLRLRQICLVAPKLAPVISGIADIMGLKICYRDGNVAKYGLENALLPVDTILLEVVAPFQPGTAAGRFLDKTGGRGGYMAIFCCDDPDARGRHANGIGVRTANVITHAPYHGVQLHPRDCRAAFIEFNHTAGSDDILGPYPPAGSGLAEVHPQRCDAGAGRRGDAELGPAGVGGALGTHPRDSRQHECRRRAGTEVAEWRLYLRQRRQRDHERADVQGRRRRKSARCGQGEEAVRCRANSFELGGVTFRLVA